MISRTLLAATGAIALLFAPIVASAQGTTATSQQERMKECNKQAAGKTGDDRKAFMSNCLKGNTAQAPAKQCKTGKLCGNTCIPKDKECHK